MTVPASSTRRRFVAVAALSSLALAGRSTCAASAPASDDLFAPVAARDAIPPPLVLPDLSGKPHDLADYRGRVVLVNFWATWCAPCLAELPSLELLQARLQRAPFTVLAVNYGESGERIREFVQRMGLDLPVLLDSFHRVRYDWKVRALPATFVVDRAGKLRYVVRGELDWTGNEAMTRIEALLG